MKVEEVARDRSLVSPSLRPADRAVRTAFVVVRVRGMLRADPSLQEPEKPNELNPAKRAQVVAQLGTEIPKAAAAYTAIWSRVSADAAANKLLPLDGPAGVDLRIGARCLRLLRLRPPEIRNRIVFTVVWLAVATHPALLDPARI